MKTTSLLIFLVTVTALGALVSGQSSRKSSGSRAAASNSKVEVVKSDDLTDECPEPNGYFADGFQCDKYYECIDGVITEKLCPDGMVFNDFSSQHEKCDLPFNIDCSTRPERQPPKPSLHCPRLNGYFAHEEENICDKFYFCVDGKFNMITCPDGLVYNEKTGICTWPDEAKKKGCSSQGNNSVIEEKEEEILHDQLNNEEIVEPDEEDEETEEEDEEESNEECQEKSDCIRSNRMIVDVREKRYIVREDFDSDSKEYSSKGIANGPHEDNEAAYSMTVHTTEDYGEDSDNSRNFHDERNDDDKYEYDDSSAEREFDEFMKYVREKMDGYEDYMNVRRHDAHGDDNARTHHDFTEDIHSWTLLDDRKADESDDGALEDYDEAYDYDFDWEEEPKITNKNKKTKKKKDKYTEFSNYY